MRLRKINKTLNWPTHEYKPREFQLRYTTRCTCEEEYNQNAKNVDHYMTDYRQGNLFMLTLWLPIINLPTNCFSSNLAYIGHSLPQIKRFTCLTMISQSDHSVEGVMSEWQIGKDAEESGSGLILRHYPSICLEGLRKTTKNLSQDSRPPGRDLNPAPPEYESGVLDTRPRRSSD
jgi:hypothetical protein